MEIPYFFIEAWPSSKNPRYSLNTSTITIEKNENIKTKIVEKVLINSDLIVEFLDSRFDELKYDLENIDFTEELDDFNFTEIFMENYSIWVGYFHNGWNEFPLPSEIKYWKTALIFYNLIDEPFSDFSLEY